MNVSDAIREIGELGVRSQRLESDYREFLNRAQRQLCERHNFSWMFDIATATIAAGDTSAPLPPNWKELDSQFSPVSFVGDSTGTRIPVKVISRAEMERMGAPASFPFAPFGSPSQYVFLENKGAAGVTVNFATPNPNSGSVTLNIGGFLFPADFSDGDNTTPILAGGEITEALLNKAKAIAYAAEDETDPRAAASQELAEYHFKLARTTDIRSRLAGRRLRM